MKDINNLIFNVTTGQLSAIEEICLRLNPTDSTIIKVTETARDKEGKGCIVKEAYVREALKLLSVAEIIEYRSRAQAGNLVTVVDLDMFNKLKAYFGL